MRKTAAAHLLQRCGIPTEPLELSMNTWKWLFCLLRATRNEGKRSRGFIVTLCEALDLGLHEAGVI